MTSRILYLPVVAANCFKSWLEIPISGSYELGAWFEMAALRSDVVVTVSYRTVGDTIQNGRAHLISTCIGHENHVFYGFCQCMLR